MLGREDLALECGSQGRVAAAQGRLCYLAQVPR